MVCALQHGQDFGRATIEGVVSENERLRKKRKKEKINDGVKYTTTFLDAALPIVLSFAEENREEGGNMCTTLYLFRTKNSMLDAVIA